MKVQVLSLATAFAAALASVAASPASAAVIVQGDSDMTQNGVKAFNPKLGRLDRVTYDISLSKARAWRISGPVTLGTTYKIDWTINGKGAVPLYGGIGGTNDWLYFPISGTGSITKTVTDYFDSRVIPMSVSGSASFDLVPTGFVGDFTIIFDPRDTGYYQSNDTTITIDNGGSVAQIPGYCGYGQSGEDSCGSARSTLTYYYTPADQLNPVPEPATWAMMILGFGAVGFLLRRRQSAVVRFT